METSDTQLPFIDVPVLGKFIDGSTSIDIYRKATDIKNYLIFNSCQPKHNKLNISFSLASCIRTIVFDEKTREQFLCELSVYLRKQHYPENSHYEWNSKSKSKRTYS